MTERIEQTLEARVGVPARRSLSGRVALFGKAWAAVSGFGLASHVAATLLLGRRAEFVELPFLVHVLSCVVPSSSGCFAGSRAPTASRARPRAWASSRAR